MKVLSLPVILLLALGVIIFTQTEFSRDPDTDGEHWAQVPATARFRAGLRALDAQVLQERGAAPEVLASEIRTTDAPMKLGAFLIYRREVSCEEYAAFLASDAGKDRAAPKGWKGRKPAPKEAKHPVTGVTREDAEAYAAWRNGRLPTEWEWEYATRRETGRYFPWGNLFNGNRAVTSTGGPVAVDDPRYETNGLFHVSGNVAEWTSSDAGDGNGAVVRGGSYRSRSHESRLTAREIADPTRGHAHIGFRIVKDV